DTASNCSGKRGRSPESVPMKCYGALSPGRYGYRGFYMRIVFLARIYLLGFIGAAVRHAARVDQAAVAMTGTRKSLSRDAPSRPSSDRSRIDEGCHRD